MPAITYDIWMRDTARIGSSRSDALKAVDAAFLTYAKLGTGDALAQLKNALDAWKATQGPGAEWKRSIRNAKRAVDRLTALTEGKGDDDSAFSPLTPNFMHEELINARLGVLYLFGRLSVNPNIFKMLLEGGLDIAGQTLEIASLPEPALGALSSGVSSIGGGGGSYVEGKLMSKVMPGSAPPGVMTSQLAGPGATTVYAERVLRDAEAAERLAARPTTRKIMDKVQSWFEALVEKIKEVIREKFGTLEGIAGTLKTLVKGCVTLFAAKAAPFVGGGLELASAIGKTVDAAVTKFRTWKAGRDVEINDGHPGVVVQSITRAMTLSLFEGLWGMLKGAGALSMDIVGFGAGGLVNLLVSIGELLIKFIWRLVEIVRMRAFCSQAGEYFLNRGSVDSIHLQPFRFTEWFRGYALNIPALSILTLNSGICGDKMRYLAMFKGGGAVSSGEFLTGASYLDGLKPWGAKYLDDSGFAFTSGDVLVNTLVTSFVTSHEKEKTMFDRVISVVTA